MAKTQTRPWDPAEHLQNDEDMAAYLNVALEEGDLGLIMAALRRHRSCQAHHRGGTGNGSGQGKPLQVTVLRGQPRVRHRPSR